MSSARRRPRGLCFLSATTLTFFCAAVQGWPQSPCQKQIRVEAVVSLHDTSSTMVNAGCRPIELVTVESEVHFSDHLQLGQAVVRIGTAEEARWAVDLGRDRLSYGDERLLGANRLSASFAPGWDGARVRTRAGRLSIDAFSVTSKFYSASLAGIFSGIQLSSASIEPYVLRKMSGVTATGVRAAGTIRSLGYNTEVVAEGREWAGHWEVSRAFGATTAGVEWNVASPAFDEFYPAQLSKYGTEDPFGWTDTRSLAFNADHVVTKQLSFAWSYRSFWDARGTYLSEHVVAGVTYSVENWTLAAGCGRTIAARVEGVPRWTPAVSIAYRF